MNYENIIYNRFIKPLLSKKTGTIGCELEFPMLNLNKKPIDKEIALGLLNHFTKLGFNVEEADVFGNPAFIVNQCGDCISYDNSYNNIEFSMNYGNDLLEIKYRFTEYLKKANEHLSKYNYLITGFGTNPYKKYIEQSHVYYKTYNMVDEYLHKFNCDNTHNFPDFPAYLSSVQTHLDVNAEDLPKVATLFAKIDFLRGVLFSNSPDFEFKKIICYRDYLWQKSAFGLCRCNTGAVDEEYYSLEDIQKSFYKRSIFNNIRNNEYTTFKPIDLDEYFKSNSQEDINQFLSFRNIEITCRGTLEVRSDCSQPLYDAFVPPAFNLGIAINYKKALELTNEFFKKYNYSNSYLRSKAVNDEILEIINPDDLRNYAIKMVNLSVDGLKSRNKNEEKLLNNLIIRAKNLMCPAKYILDNKDNIDKVILEYSKIGDA